MMSQTSSQEKGAVSADLLLANYHYELPPELVAQRPSENRGQSRLLFFDEETKSHEHHQFDRICELLPKGAILVVNQSKVVPCRLLGQKSSGGKAEVFVLSLESDERGAYRCLVKYRGKKSIGDKLFLPANATAEISGEGGDGTFSLTFSVDDLSAYLFEHGLVPIPPYIREGQSDNEDKKRYQTVYAKDEGSTAAPTAGLHFSQELIEQLTAQGFSFAPITLHVGLGTFSPVKAQQIDQHQMHSERFYIPKESLELLHSGRPIIAVGTTSLRALESAYRDGRFDSAGHEWRDTSIFLYPGKQVHSIDGLITNFHLPGSSLLMLVSALIGRERVLNLYAEAVKERYRFFSYGDAMFIKRAKGRE
jgi:S-adenosylmethionine:tRNA ribosyltransferase-isomerase